MQTRDQGGDIRVTFYCKDPRSITRQDCATFYRTDRESWVVQGDRLGPEVAAQLVGLNARETYLEVPQALIDRFVLFNVFGPTGERVDVRLSEDGETVRRCAGAFDEAWARAASFEEYRPGR